MFDLASSLLLIDIFHLYFLPRDICILVGIMAYLVGYVLYAVLVSKNRLKTMVFGLISALGGYLGSKFFGWLTYLEINWYINFNIVDSLGTFIGACLPFVFCKKIFGNYDLLRIQPAFIFTTLAFIKSGCLVNGCCGGRTFGDFVFPSQLFELLSLISAILLCVFGYSFSKTFKTYFWCTFIYLVSRIISEPLREPASATFFGMTAPFIGCVIFLIIIVIFYIRDAVKSLNKMEPDNS